MLTLKICNGLTCCALLFNVGAIIRQRTPFFI
jgi:hypothetical protein